jgi:hypothetical protein
MEKKITGKQYFGVRLKVCQAKKQAMEALLATVTEEFEKNAIQAEIDCLNDDIAHYEDHLSVL